MNNSTLDSLNLSAPKKCYQTAGGAQLQGTSLVKEKLLLELVELGKQMAVLEGRAGMTDFSMLQTYKEMIQSRKSYFNELS